MNRSLKLLIIFGCALMILGAYYFGYRFGMNKTVNYEPNQKPASNINTVVDNNVEYDELINVTPFEDIVAPGASLQKNIESISTGRIITEYEGEIPSELENATEKKVREYFKNYDIVEFSKNRIIVTRKMTYLPDKYVVKAEGDYVYVYKTDSEGNAVRYEELEPYPLKNVDDELKKGIEVDYYDNIFEVIADYE